MPKMKVEKIDHTARTYCPGVASCIIDTDEITCMYEIRVNRIERPCVKIVFRNGESIECYGSPDDFVDEDDMIRVGRD